MELEAHPLFCVCLNKTHLTETDEKLGRFWTPMDPRYAGCMPTTLTLYTDHRGPCWAQALAGPWRGAGGLWTVRALVRLHCIDTKAAPRDHEWL